VVEGTEHASVGPGVVSRVDGILSVEIARLQLVGDAASNSNSRSEREGHSETHQPGEHLHTSHKVRIHRTQKQKGRGEGRRKNVRHERLVV